MVLTRFSYILAALLVAVIVIVISSTEARAQTDYSYISKWGIDNADSGTTLSSMGVDFSTTNGRLYSADTLNDRIVMFDPNSSPNNGTLRGSFGSNGSAAGQFDGIGGLAVAPNGKVYVSDTGNNRVQAFNKNGSFLGSWPVSTPRAIAVAPNGEVYVIDDDFGINRYSSGGIPLGNTGGLDASDLTVDPDGEVAYISPRWATLTVLDSSLGSELREWDLPCKDDGGLDICWGGSAIDSDQFGNFYVANGWVDKIHKFGNDGTDLTFWGEPGTGNAQLGNVRGIAVSPAGNVFTADEALDRIQKWAPIGGIDLKIYDRYADYESHEDGWAEIRGWLKSDSVGIRRSPVYIQKRIDSSSPWQWHATVYTSPTGFIDKWFKVNDTYQYRAVFPRGAGTKSNIITIDITKAITAWNPYPKITYGGWTRIHGLLDPRSDWKYTNQTMVSLEVWDYASSTWRRKATTTSSGTGYYSFWFKPYGTSHYRMTAWNQRFISDQVTKTVRKKVTMTPSTWNMDLGDTNTINVEIEPKHEGSIAFLREWNSAQQKCVWVKTLTMSSSSRASYSWTPSTAGWHALRVFAPHHWDHTWNDSRVHWIKVN